MATPVTEMMRHAINARLPTKNILDEDDAGERATEHCEIATLYADDKG
jgi:hypothetical protein